MKTWEATESDEASDGFGRLGARQTWKHSVGRERRVVVPDNPRIRISEGTASRVTIATREGESTGGLVSASSGSPLQLVGGSPESTQHSHALPGQDRGILNR